MRNKTAEVLSFMEAIMPGCMSNFEGGICPSCLEPIGEFRDAISIKEYKISGLCQKCQDSVFGV